MMRTLAFRFLALLFVAVAAAACAADGARIWYEDNNLGKAGGMPADFFEKFAHPESFREATSYIDVYMVRANTLDDMSDSFLTEVFKPYLTRNGIKLALNVGGATWMQEQGRDKVLKREMKEFARLKKLGLDVDFVSLQSVLCKPRKTRDEHGRKGEEKVYPVEQRVKDVVAYAKAVRAVYPKAEVGIIDSLPAHGKEYRQPYRVARDALAAAGINLAYVHLDISLNILRTNRRGVNWQSILELERYVEKDLGVRFGYFTVSRQAGETSSKAYHDAVMAALDCYASAGGTPGDLIVASWFNHPSATIPEDAAGHEYPAMRIVKEFGREVSRIEDNRAGWAAQWRNNPNNRALCADD